MYPIGCPVAVLPPAFLNLGALERSVSVALNNFNNQSGGVGIPLISDDWERITSFNLTSADHSNVLGSLRRLGDAAEMLVTQHQEIEARVLRASTSRISQHGVDINQNDQTRLKEMLSKPLFRRSGAQAASPRAKWHLGSFQRGQGQVFVNDDGRSIHLKSTGQDHAVLGYGWHNGLMHYVEINSQFHSGRSVALFGSFETRASDFSPPFFSSMVQSLMDFYGSGVESPGSKIIVTGTDRKKSPISVEGLATDRGFLNDAYRSLSLADDFTVETKNLVDGSRNPSFKGISPAVPQAQFRFVVAENRVVTTLYRTPKSATVGEIGLSPEQRTRLHFPKLASRPPPRSPSRP